MFFNCPLCGYLQIDQIERKVLNITTLVAKTLASKLASATSNVKVLFGNDINITYRVVNQLLKYENKQYGLSLTVEQDSNYLQVKHRLNVWTVCANSKQFVELS